jgi:hypothetical protein
VKLEERTFCDSGSPEEIRAKLQQIVPEYRPTPVGGTTGAGQPAVEEQAESVSVAVRPAVALVR